MRQNDNSHDVEALFQRARGGDGEAWGTLFTIYVNDIYRYALVKLTNVMDAQDIAAETFKKVWLKLPTMEYQNFRAYLYRVAHNMIIDNYRAQGKVTTNDKLLALLEDDLEQPEEIVAKKQDAQMLYNAIKQLSKEFQDVINCRFLEELSVAETASILGRSQIWVRVAQFRALKKLRVILSNHD